MAIPPGYVHLIRFIRSSHLLDVFGEKFVMPADVEYEIKTRDLGSYKKQQINKANYMAKRLDGIAGVKVDIAYNVNSTAMVLLTIDPELTKITAWEINRLLEEQSPIIKTRDYDASQGYFSLEPAFLDEEDVKLVCDRLVSIFQNASKQDLSAIVEVPTRLDHMVSIKKKWLYM